MPSTTRSSGAADDATQPGETLCFEISGALAGQRLDRALAALVPSLTRTRAHAAIEAGRVRVNGRLAKPSLPLEPGMLVTLAPEAQPVPVDTSERVQAVPPLPIVYEDTDVLVVNKPAGVVVHPAAGHATGTLVDALRAYIPGLETDGDASRPGIVHRLDKDTSGLLVIAKTPSAHAALAAQMKEHRMVKRYLAMVEGELPVPEGIVEAPIGRDRRFRQRMAVVAEAAGGRASRTRFRVLGTRHGRSLLELQLETGRTHQIRVHLAAVQHPVVGDRTYGRPQPPQPPRQFLHAAHLEFAHPITGAWLSFDAPLPEELTAFLREWER